MFEFPATYKNFKTQHLTKLPLMLFAKENKCQYLYPSLEKEKLISSIERFANESDQNEELVMNWIDKVSREGKKDLYIYKFDDNPFVKQLLLDEKNVKNILDSNIGNLQCKHILGNIYDKNWKIVRYELLNNSFGHIISIYMCKLIYDLDAKMTEMYPVVVDLYVDKGLMSVKVKTKTNFMNYERELIELENINISSPEKQADNAMTYICRILQLDSTNTSTDDLKYKLYKLVDECTHTPDEIRELLDNNKKFIEDTTSKIVNEICKIDNGLYDDVNWDISNMLEKYFSMTYPNQGIFTHGRKAYPIVLDATDQQFSRVKQISAADKPLQSKDIFFDNKKMLQKNRMCEVVKFAFHRLDKTYTKEDFSVTITVKRRCCICKFFEYTSEEDINNVLLSIIGDEE